MKLGYIYTRYLLVLKDVLIAEGVDPVPLFKKYELSDSLLENPRGRVSLSRLMYICHEAIELIGKPWLGLLMARQQHIGNLGLPGWTAITAETAEQVIATYIEYQDLVSRNVRGRSRLYRQPKANHLVCELYSMAPYNDYNCFSIDHFLGTCQHLVYLVTGQQAVMQRVDIEYPDMGYGAEMEAYFQCPVVFSADRNAVVYRDSIMQLRSQYANVNSHNQARELAERELAVLRGDNLFSERVTDAIMTMLTASPPSVDEVADQLGITSWTLRRRLKKENTRFQDLLDKTRQDLALSYVSDSIHSFSEIAYMLGFSSPAAFHRAFRRWTGDAPGEYRKSKENTKG
ncbi:AraC family transcriptional regulator [Pseudomaricurvus alkylphenolicus]|jgi:AraC-like DNA-binding protein|uniref:AraC family transcriptional regulator n=1 Tax=Pseudomaricurvus alkylphenolicus TaxID=1306991 RepID=UPI00141D95B6|nr:AraC family transcriptional regulator [Pseudomaricurvus alkylphenolicus]NIB41410.1 AraC family transcriptional regulator [Pseudomaricurvus alkylphenolicus]